MRNPSDFPSFDIHHHVGSLDIVSGAAGNAVPTLEDDIERRLAYMDENNIAQVMLMPSNGYAAPDGIAATRRVNDYVARYRDTLPRRFPAAVGTVSPLDGPGAVAELDRCIEGLGMKGIVWHHRFQGTAIDHPMMDPFLERLQHYKLPAFIHLIADSSLESPWRLEILADRYPDVQFVALDGFSSPDHAHWMPYLASKHPNIIFDTGVLVSVSHLIEIFVRKVGAHRLLLGTDFYSFPKLFNTAFPLNEILASDLTDEECRAILYGNAKRLLSIN